MTDEVKFIQLADIVKTEKTPEGTLLVYGKAAGDALDRDLQKLDLGWLAKEMPAWFESGANVREMHQPIAAGVGVKLEKRDDGTFWVLSEAVDPTTITKLEKKVLTGYSVGIKRPQWVQDPSAPNGRCVGGSIIELSYADRPADPTNKVTIGKIDAASDEGELEFDESQVKVAAPDETKGDAWDAAMAGETVGQLRAARQQLGYGELTGTDAILASVLDALLSMAYQEEVEAVREAEDGEMVYQSVTADQGKVFVALAEAVKHDADAPTEPAPTPEAGETEDSPTDGPEEGSESEEGAAGEPAPAGDEVPDTNKLANPDDVKTLVADTVKAAVEEGLAPLKDGLAKVDDLVDRIGKLEALPAVGKVQVRAVDRVAGVGELEGLDASSVLQEARQKAERMAQSASDPAMRAAYVSKVAQLDEAIAATSR